MRRHARSVGAFCPGDDHESVTSPAAACATGLATSLAAKVAHKARDARDIYDRSDRRSCRERRTTIPSFLSQATANPNPMTQNGLLAFTITDPASVLDIKNWNN